MLLGGRGPSHGSLAVAVGRGKLAPALHSTERFVGPLRVTVGAYPVHHRHDARAGGGVVRLSPLHVSVTVVEPMS